MKDWIFYRIEEPNGFMVERIFCDALILTVLVYENVFSKGRQIVLPENYYKGEIKCQEEQIKDGTL